jgi:hypothetical protein
MKDFIAVHTFKSSELRDQYFAAAGSMSEAELVEMTTGANAVCMKNWANEQKMVAYCHWKAVSHEAIIEQLGDMNNFFDTVSDEMTAVLNFEELRK